MNPSTSDLLLTIELVRVDQAEDPFAFRFAPQDYLVRSEGGGFSRAHLDWNPQLLATLQSLRLERTDPALLQGMGETLRGFLATAGWDAYEERILAARAERRRVVLTLRSAAAELYALPWELLTLKASGQRLGELPDVLLRYAWPEARVVPEEGAGSGRILFAWSAAAGPVPAGEQMTALAKACRDGAHPFDPQRDVVAGASLRGLLRALETASQEGRPFSVLHLLCHGAATGQTFGLALGSDAPGSQLEVIDAARLRQILLSHAATLRLIVLSACDSSNSGALGNQLGSVAQTLHRAGFAAVVGSRFPLSVPGSVQLTEGLYRALLVGPESLETALLRCRQRLALGATNQDWAGLQFYVHPDGENEARARVDTRPIKLRPYRGLLSFQREHSRFFFGRECEVEEICGDLRALEAAARPLFLVVAGASGTGKSSVVLAGVVPRLLAENPGLRLGLLRPGSDPLAALARAMAEPAPGRGGAVGSSMQLLVVDQLEELFTQVSDPSVRQAFVRKLWQLASDPAQSTRVLVTLRVDFIGRCGEILLQDGGARLDTVAYDEAHRLFLTQMPRAALHRAITEPAQRVGLQLEEGLAERLLDDIGGEPGSLPLLADALDLLWQRRRGALLTQAAYDESGGVSGALKQRADALIDGFDAVDQRIARRLLVRLVDVADDVEKSTRRRVPLAMLRPRSSADAGQAPRFDGVLQRLLESRLILQDSDGSEPIIEVAHEALIRRWPRLVEWVRADRRMLADLDKIEAWTKQWHEMGTLLVGAQIGYATELLHHHPDDFPAAARELLAASTQQAQRRAKRRRQLGRLVLGLCVLLGIQAWISRREAVEARAASRAARDAARMAAVRELQEVGARAALLREVEAEEPQNLRGWVEAATAALRNIAYPEWDLATKAPTERPLDSVLQLSGDCARVITLQPSGAAQVWSREGLDATIPLAGPAGALRLLAVSPSGDRFLIAADDPTAQLIPTDGTGSPRRLVGHRHRITTSAFSPDGRSWVTGSTDATVRIWSADGGSTELAGHSDRILAVAFSPDGKRLVSAAADKTLRLWELSGRELARTPLEQGPSAIGFAPDGRIFSSDDHGVHRFEQDGSTLRPLPDLPESESLLDQASIPGRGGDWLGSAPLASWDAVRLFSADRIRLVPLARYRDQIRSVMICNDRRRFATMTAFGRVSVWSLGQDLRKLGVRVLADTGVKQALISASSDRILTVHSDGAVRGWDTAGTEAPSVLFARKIPPGSTALSPDGQQLAVVDEDGTAWLQRGRVAQPLKLPGRFSLRSPPSWSADGRRLLLPQIDSASVWSSTAEALFSTPRQRDRVLLSAAFTPAGQKILNVFSHGTVQVWSEDGQTLVREVSSSEDAINSPRGSVACWLAGSSRFVTLYPFRPARIWSSEDSGPPTLLHLPTEPHELACSADGRWIAAALVRPAIFRADGTGAPRMLTAHLREVTAMSFSADGEWLATSSRDGTARVHRVNGSAAPIVLSGQEKELASVTLSPDHSVAVTVGEYGSAWLWSLAQEGAAAPKQLLRALWEAGTPCPDWKIRTEHLNDAPGRAREEQVACEKMRDCALGSQAADPTSQDPDPIAACLAEFRKKSAGR